MSCFISLLVNSADPDQTAPKEQSDLGLHRLTMLVSSNCSGINDVKIFPKNTVYVIVFLDNHNLYL